MTTEMTLAHQEEHLFQVLSSERFLQMEGLGNEVPFFIYPFPPDDALRVKDATRRIKNRLSTQQGIEVLEINLYKLSVHLLQARGVWDRLLVSEPEREKEEFLDSLREMLHPERHVAPAIRDQITGQDFQILFLTGIGEVFPYIRSHNVLNNLQSVVTDKPMLMFFPGEYRQSQTVGSSLVLFNRLTDDQYYRAKDIRHQEP